MPINVSVKTQQNAADKPDVTVKFKGKVTEEIDFQLQLLLHFQTIYFLGWEQR